MKSKDIRQKFLSFFKERNHTIVPSSSLIPDDPSVLLTTAGMQQFKPYFVGKADPLRDFGSKNTASVQKSFRTSDIEEVGDPTHLTFFEMLGHFSFGDYFKRETVEWTYTLLTEVFGIASERISATVFEGDTAVPFDEESFLSWSRFLAKDRIGKGSRQNNFWGPAGAEGPCGACNEVYVDGTEVATLVFMEYYCRTNETLEPLAKKGVDVGWGFERLTMLLQKVPTIFETDLFSPLMEFLPPGLSDRSKRIFADHARGIVFLISDGVRPSNKETGYILRRLMRRIITYAVIQKIELAFMSRLFTKIVEIYGPQYKELNADLIINQFNEEREKFEKALPRGIKELEKIENIESGEDLADKLFRIYESYGVYPDMSLEILKGRGFRLDTFIVEGFENTIRVRRAEHREKSRAGQEKKFGGHGLILDTGELKAGNEEELKKVTRLHTATHMLQQALREVLGLEVHQAGSDITPERTRFDFTFPRKLTLEEIKAVEKKVNEKIKEDLPMQKVTLPKSEAEKTGALYFFKEKYPDPVNVYFVGKSLETAWSKEFCGGPHVTHTGEIQKFRIAKEEAVGAGVRRIRGVVEP